mmetsp:Transcript_18107/g.54637  ORF Transcript_18107/g.54637 Transcript_18107/m.54637 type:complete len:108 (-) Transcript_18107:80-403(-)
MFEGWAEPRLFICGFFYARPSTRGRTWMHIIAVPIPILEWTRCTAAQHTQGCAVAIILPAAEGFCVFAGMQGLTLSPVHVFLFILQSCVLHCMPACPSCMISSSTAA